MSTPAHPAHPPQGALVPTEELIRQQGIKPLASLDDLAGENPFGSDEEYTEFLADLYAARHRDS